MKSLGEIDKLNVGVGVVVACFVRDQFEYEDRAALLRLRYGVIINLDGIIVYTH
jgi:hypothetical protein